MIFNAETLDLHHFNPVTASYAPKVIKTEAICVTSENVGRLALEFDEELFYDPNGRPFFTFQAERDGEENKVSRMQYVRVSDWIVPLRGQLYIYRDRDFQHTFALDYTEAREAWEKVPADDGYAPDHRHSAEGVKLVEGDLSVGETFQGPLQNL
jgi:hypothetical protein